MAQQVVNLKEACAGKKKSIDTYGYWSYYIFEVNKYCPLGELYAEIAHCDIYAGADPLNLFG